ncbi:hypothetical protein K7432_012878 [Basidiobolus ranarum]|uniref:Uncharacterized protein n=1 Tax=Basidiobolus ranarum TaxID=34480 RepID=A0ABR2VRK1_9FUNG
MVRKFLKALPRLSLMPQRERSAISPVSSPTAHNFSSDGFACRTKMAYNFLDDKIEVNRVPSTSEKKFLKPLTPLSPKFASLTDPLRTPIFMEQSLKSPSFHRMNIQATSFQKDNAETAKERLQRTKNFDDMIHNGFYNDSNGQYEETLRFSLTPSVARH